MTNEAVEVGQLHSLSHELNAEQTNSLAKEKVA